MNFQKADFKASYGLSGQLPPSDRPEIIFAGRSNVGKSSLINKLCNRKNLARVSATPGKTATINFYEVDAVYFVDLPGYGYAKIARGERRRWDELINGYFGLTRCRALVLQLLDCRHAPSADDVVMMEYLTHYQIPFHVVLTKGDKLKKSETAEKLSFFQTACSQYTCKGIILVSSEKGDGIKELQEVITTHIREGEE
ncbi:MAG: ribosome biogenesis GTP-binding protein YihA/YsxC [Oscillospiraceae bacterium]|nr:ribosome biogenesis GTP-binding protein YihA/YsxC [Oscillospiraceae bacterium]